MENRSSLPHKRAPRQTPYGDQYACRSRTHDQHPVHAGVGVGQATAVGVHGQRSAGAEPRIRSPPPLLGQHTDEVLRDMLGYGESEIKELRDKKVVA